MANWQRQLDISKEWKQSENEEISLQEFAQLIVQKLQELPLFDNMEFINEIKENIIEEFRMSVIENNDADFDDFNYCMNMLYDWGDISLDSHWNGAKVCWINTF